MAGWTRAFSPTPRPIPSSIWTREMALHWTGAVRRTVGPTDPLLIRTRAASGQTAIGTTPAALKHNRTAVTAPAPSSSRTTCAATGASSMSMPAGGAVPRRVPRRSAASSPDASSALPRAPWSPTAYGMETQALSSILLAARSDVPSAAHGRTVRALRLASTAHRLGGPAFSRMAASSSAASREKRDGVQQLRRLRLRRRRVPRPPRPQSERPAGTRRVQARGPRPAWISL